MENKKDAKINNASDFTFKFVLPKDTSSILFWFNNTTSTVIIPMRVETLPCNDNFSFNITYANGAVSSGITREKMLVIDKGILIILRHHIDMEANPTNIIKKFKREIFPS